MKYKIFFIITASIVLFMGAAAASQKSTADSVVSTDPVRTIRIQIEGLRDSRVEKADHAVRRVPGVLKVEFNVSDKEALVTFNVEATSLKKLDESLRAAGFTPWIH